MVNNNNNLQLVTGGKISTKDGREFTRLVGGFDGNSSTITDKQVAELLGYAKGARSVRQRVSENIKHFEVGLHILDLKSGVPQQDTYTKILKDVGYTKQGIIQAENIYIFSKAGFLLFLKFAEGDKAVELYKDFIEDYFQAKVENIVMKQTLQEELEFLIEQKVIACGRVICEPDETKKIEWFQEAEKLNKRITSIEIAMSKDKLMKALEPTIAIADKFTDANEAYDVGVFSKVLRIKGLGRNNLFAWMREKGILMKSNNPYQKYLQYFKVLPLDNPFTGKIDYKTMIKPNGVTFIVKKLIEDEKLITKSIDEILAELENVDIAV